MIPSPRYFATWPSKPVIAAAAARWYSPTVSRHSSGSSCAAIPVEPTTSQNSTVRCRHSPASSRAWIGGVAETGVWAGALRGAPHLPQKFEVGELSAPHFAHVRASALPQCAQKLFSGGFSESHFEQCVPRCPPLGWSQDRLNSHGFDQAFACGGSPSMGQLDYRSYQRDLVFDSTCHDGPPRYQT
jgi:hypothetical protein